jgi:hypothetical protein
MGFFGNSGRPKTNVTGVDRNGHEWTPADISCGKKCLTGFLISKEGRKKEARRWDGKMGPVMDAAAVR